MLIVKASNKNPQRSVAKKLEEIKCSQLTNKEQWLLGINKETNQIKTKHRCNKNQIDLKSYRSIIISNVSELNVPITGRECQNG